MYEHHRNRSGGRGGGGVPRGADPERWAVADPETSERGGGGQETWNIRKHFLWLFFTGQGRRAWPPWIRYWVGAKGAMAPQSLLLLAIKNGRHLWLLIFHVSCPSWQSWIHSGADLGGGPRGPGPPPLTPNFEAQIFAASATPLRDVGKISAGPPPYTNPGSAPATIAPSAVEDPEIWGGGGAKSSHSIRHSQHSVSK